jgi:hypothetical protein
VAPPATWVQRPMEMPTKRDTHPCGRLPSWRASIGRSPLVSPSPILAPHATKCIKKNWPDRPRHALVKIEACRLKKGGTRDGPRDAGRRQGDRRGTLRGCNTDEASGASPTKTKSPNPDSGIPSGLTTAHFHSGAARVGRIDDARKSRARCFGVVGPKLAKRPPNAK